MAEENPTQQSPEIKALFEAQQKITQEIGKLSQAQEKQGQFFVAALEKLGKGPAAKEPESTASGEWADYDESLARAVTHTAKSEAKKEAEAAEKRLEGKIDKRINTEKQEQVYNNMLYKDYPQVLDSSHPLQAEFLKVKAQKVQSDPDFLNRPSAVYDLTAIAYANLVRRGDIVQEEFADEVRRTLAINDGGMVPPGGGGGRTPEKEEDLTASQVHFQKSFNVPVERYIKQLKDMKSQPKVSQ